MPPEYAPEYVEARRVLLDALEALGNHRKAVVLVGAQAIYHHVGAGTLLVAEFTTDGDLSVRRAVEVAVASLGALLVAKLHKLAEREPTPARWSPKDGLDVLRILQVADLGRLGTRLAGLERHEVAGPITAEARPLLRSLFGTKAAHGTAMAVRASHEVEDAATIGQACEVLASRLLSTWERALVAP